MQCVNTLKKINAPTALFIQMYIK